MAVKIHEFADTGEAYDAAMCREEIKDGDVLSVPREGVVGILVEAWPVATTPKSGAFHEPAETFDWYAVEPVSGGPTKDYGASLDVAASVFAEFEHHGHYSPFGGWFCDTCRSPYCELA